MTRRRLGIGLLVAGACGACWVAPVLIAAIGAGWLGALGVGWAWAAAAAVVIGGSLVALRLVQRRRRPGCACPPA